MTNRPDQRPVLFWGSSMVQPQPPKQYEAVLFKNGIINGANTWWKSSQWSSCNSNKLCIKPRTRSSFVLGDNKPTPSTCPMLWKVKGTSDTAKSCLVPHLAHFVSRTLLESMRTAELHRFQEVPRFLRLTLHPQVCGTIHNKINKIIIGGAVGHPQFFFLSRSLQFRHVHGNSKTEPWKF